MSLKKSTKAKSFIKELKDTFALQFLNAKLNYIEAVEKWLFGIPEMKIIHKQVALSHEFVQEKETKDLSKIDLFIVSYKGLKLLLAFTGTGKQLWVHAITTKTDGVRVGRYYFQKWGYETLTPGSTKRFDVIFNNRMFNKSIPFNTKHY